jgi:hypothetical protein
MSNSWPQTQGPAARTTAGWQAAFLIDEGGHSGQTGSGLWAVGRAATPSIVNVRSVFIASEELGGLAVSVNR